MPEFWDKVAPEAEALKEKAEKSKVMSEGDYFSMATEYALGSGWVKENEKDILKEKYLQPIFAKYLETIEELKAEKDKISEEELSDAIYWLNQCLEATRRIGSTEPKNILRTVLDCKRLARNDYSQYAVMAMYELIVDIL